MSAPLYGGTSHPRLIWASPLGSFFTRLVPALLLLLHAFRSIFCAAHSYRLVSFPPGFRLPFRSNPGAPGPSFVGFTLLPCALYFLALSSGTPFPSLPVRRLRPLRLRPHFQPGISACWLCFTRFALHIPQTMGTKTTFLYTGPLPWT